MPPLPLRPAPDPTLELSSLTRTLADVRGYQLPRLRGCTSAALARDLAAEARADLESVRAGLESSREACASLPDGSRDAVLDMWEGVEREFLEVRDEFRAALVTSKRASAAAARKHELLEPDDVPRAEPSVGIGGDDALQTKTNEVTDAMRRTAQMLQQELEKSVLSSQMLDQSTQSIRATHGLYDAYAGLLSTSAQLVRVLERADWWDRVMILSALAFFLLCVAYVIKRRILDRVGGFAAWWVGGSYRLVKMGLGGGSAKAVTTAAGAAAGVDKGLGAAVGAGRDVASVVAGIAAGDGTGGGSLAGAPTVSVASALTTALTGAAGAAAVVGGTDKLPVVAAPSGAPLAGLEHGARVAPGVHQVAPSQDVEPQDGNAAHGRSREEL